IPTFQSLKLKRGQRLIHSGGVSPMGWGIPAAIGAAFAAPGRQIVCLVGDGGAMMNIQELATIAHHKLPISFFVYANNGYETSKLMQDNHFRRESVAGPESGVGFPDLSFVAMAFGIPSVVARSGPDMWRTMLDREGPVLTELKMAPNQVIAP